MTPLLNKSKVSTLDPLPDKNKPLLENQWVVGLTYKKGCFSVTISPNPTMKTKFQVIPEFVVVQHKRDENLLLLLKEKFGCGVVRRNHGDRLCYRVRNLKDLENIIRPFFYPLPASNKEKQGF